MLLIFRQIHSFNVFFLTRFFCSTAHHSHDDVLEEDFDQVIYEVDSDDEEWLRQHGTIFEDDSRMDVDGLPSPHALQEGQVSLGQFEWMIQWLEKRAFKAAQSVELYSARNSAQFDDTPCTVCRNRESDDLNQILICDGCEVAVHQNCYGIRSVPDGAWKCEACAQGLDPNHLICELCLAIGGGIFKPIKNFQPIFTSQDASSLPDHWRFKRLRKHSPLAWGHVQCAKWLALAGLEKENGEGAIIQRPAKRADLEGHCYLCTREKGATTKCSDSGCSVRFHILCAQKKAFALTTSNSRHQAYCEAHTPNKLLAWRKEQLKHRDSEKLARRKLKRRKETLVFSGIRRGEAATPSAIKYWGGLLEEATISKLQHALTKSGYDGTFSNELLSSVFRHWVAKRTKSSGLPLIKSFHPSYASNTSTVLLNATRGSEIEKIYRKLCLLRTHLLKLRELAEKCVDRELLKQRNLVAKRRLYENVLNPTLGAQIHLLTVASTDLDTTQSFLSSATLDHPYDWLTVLSNARNGKYDHDADDIGGGEFFQDLLSVVDPEKVNPSLRSQALVVRERLLKIRDGELNEVKFQRNAAPLSIMLPRATVDIWRASFARMKDNPGYSALI